MGDIRLDRRRDVIVEGVVKTGSLVQRKVGGDRAGEVGMLNFLASPKVTTDDILAPALRLTAQAARGRRIVAAQDTTEVNFSGRDKRRRGLGPAGDGKTPGFFTHAVIAIDADDEAVIGPVSAHIWTREASQAAKDGERRFEAKESARWLSGADKAADVLVDATRIIVVSDRESDIYPVFARRPQRVDLVVRAAQNRALADGGLLFEASSGWPALGGQIVKVEPKERTFISDRAKLVSRSDKRSLSASADKGRTAKILIKAGPVTIRRSSKGGLQDDPKTLALNMVEAVEIDPPAGVKPLLWRLITTLSVATLEDAMEVVRCYRLRWRIEQLFRTLKKDGLDLEATQLEDAGRIMKLAALGVVASCRIMQLVDARDGGERLATDAIPAEQIEDVAAISAAVEGGTDRQKNPWKKGSLAWLSWVRLGGWNCYYKKPGPKTMADGWKRLRDMLDAFVIAQTRLQLV